MTSGYREADTRVYNSGPVPPFGSYQTGGYATRVWGGDDYPHSMPNPPYVFGWEWRRVFVGLSPRGKKVFEDRLVEVLRRAKPPKRTRQEDHYYYAQGYRSVVSEPIQISTDPGGPWGFENSAFNDIPFSAPADWYFSAYDDYALAGSLRGLVAGSNFNAGIFLGEGHKSLKLIADATLRVYNGVKAVRKGNFSHAAELMLGGKIRNQKSLAKVIKNANARSWLELQYAWKPLISDVYAGTQFLAHQFRAPLQYTLNCHRFSGGRSEWIFDALSSSSRYVYPNAKMSDSKHLKAMLREVDVPALAGLMNPAAVAWELTPFSFIADWFIPVGAYLDARGLSQALTGTFVTSRYIRQSFSGSPRATSGSYLKPGGEGKLVISNFYVERKVLNSLDIPTPSVKPLNKVLSWQRAANAVALMINAKF